MRRIINSFLACCLALICIFTYVGCKSDKNPDTELPEQAGLEETDYDLVSSGKSDYVIVIPEEDSKMLNFAVSELQLFFEEATNIKLPVILDSQVNNSQKCISLGETELFAQQNLSVNYDELGRSGYIIEQEDGNVYISGASDYGTAWGVYEFLEYQFNYKYFYKETYTLDRNVRNRKLLNFNNKTIPSIDQCYLAFGEVIGDETHAHRMRTYTQADVYAALGASRWHSALAIIGEMTPEQKALWYDTSTSQPCFTRDREGLSTHMAENIMDALRIDKTATAVNIGQADNSNWCTCTECSAEREKYGTNSATYIKTVNMIAEKVQAMLDKEQPGREITITFFAYLASLEPPVRKTEGGDWEPVNEDVRLADNVCVLNAPISMNAYQYWPLEDEHNRNAREIVDKWAAMGNEQYFWIYNNTFYGNYFTPVDSLNGTQKTLQYLEKSNARWVMQQGQQNNTVSPDWSRLKAYIDAELAWDVNADMNQLIDNFMQAYFGPAAEVMSAFYDDFRTWYSYAANLPANSGLTETRTMNASFFPRATLNRWLNYIEEAYTAIEPLKKEDPERYEAFSDRILLESISPRYVQMYIFGTSDFSENELDTMETQFRSDCAKLGIMMKWEHGSLEGNELF